MPFEVFPYTNFHELNLDWLIDAVKDVKDNIDTTAENAQIATDKANEAKSYAETAQEAVQTLAGVKRRYIFLGDSYGQGYTPEQTTTGWPVRIKSILNIANDDYYENCIGGVGFCNTVNGQNWITMLSGINATNPETITDIIVAGGYNDKSYSVTDITDAITTFLSIAKTEYPNATVRIGMIAYSFETAGTVIQELNNVLIGYQRCSFLNSNAVYMNNIENTLTNSFYMSSSDKHHPNNYGQGFIAMNIINCIKTGSCDIKHSQYSPLTLASGVSSSSPGGVNSSVFNNLLNAFVNAGIFSGSFAYSGGNTDIKLGTFNGDICFNGDTNKNMYAATNVIIRKDTGNQYRETPAIVYITKNELHVILRLINDAGNNFQSGNILQIQLPGFISFNTTTFTSI